MRRTLLSNTRHFGKRIEERGVDLSPRRKKKFDVLYTALSNGTARTVGLHGRYAVQFGGEPGGQGDYLVVNITAGHVDGFISLLVDQRVIVSGTSIIPSWKVLPLNEGGRLSNPRRNPFLQALRLNPRA
jgi:hypothetical protein